MACRHHPKTHESTNKLQKTAITPLLQPDSQYANGNPHFLFQCHSESAATRRVHPTRLPIIEVQYALVPPHRQPDQTPVISIKTADCQPFQQQPDSHPTNFNK